MDNKEHPQKPHRFLYTGTHVTDGHTIGPFNNLELQARGFNTMNIRQCVFGNRHSHHSYYWTREETGATND